MLSLGGYKTKEHYSVQGSMTSFYVWLRNDEHPKGNSSKWITGRLNTYHQLKRAFNSDKEEFVRLVTQIFEEKYDKD